MLLECFKLHTQVKDKSARDDLHLFENYVRKFPPVLTAADVFQLNQGLYSAFCSALVTYLIVLIQFNAVNIGSNYSFKLRNGFEKKIVKKIGIHVKLLV